MYELNYVISGIGFWNLALEGKEGSWYWIKGTRLSDDIEKQLGENWADMTVEVITDWAELVSKETGKDVIFDDDILEECYKITASLLAQDLNYLTERYEEDKEKRFQRYIEENYDLYEEEEEGEGTEFSEEWEKEERLIGGEWIDDFYVNNDIYAEIEENTDLKRVLEKWWDDNGRYVDDEEE